MGTLFWNVFKSYNFGTNLSRVSATGFVLWIQWQWNIFGVTGKKSIEFTIEWEIRFNLKQRYLCSSAAVLDIDFVWSNQLWFSVILTSFVTHARHFIIRNVKSIAAPVAIPTKDEVKLMSRSCNWLSNGCAIHANISIPSS